MPLVFLAAADFQAGVLEVVAVALGKTLKNIFIILLVFFIVFFILFFIPGKIILSPVIIDLGILKIKWYGALIATSIYLSYLLISKRYNKIFIKDNFDYIFLITLVSGLIGARIGYAIQNLDYFATNPFDFFKIYQGGLSIHGGILGGMLGLWITAKKTKLSFISLANIISPEVLLSIAIGRFGNFFNREIIGQPTNGIIKMFVEPQYRPAGLEDISYYHPVFLYESVLLLILYFYITRNTERIKKNGLLYLLIGYSAVRIVVEFFRIDYKPIFLIFDLAQLVSLAIILIVLLVILLAL
jgi:phosphatidylglycerol:prolipoprotein diacylglycerol transferase